MGYSIMTFFEDEAVHVKMLKFLDSEYRPWEKIGKKEGIPTERGPTHDVAYGPDDQSWRVIGFDFVCGGVIEVAYVYRICQWMAVMTGEMQILYDGEDVQKLTHKKGSKDPISVTKDGFSLVRDYECAYMFFGSGQRGKNDVIIKQELQRLTKGWKAYG